MKKPKSLVICVIIIIAVSLTGAVISAFPAAPSGNQNGANKPTFYNLPVIIFSDSQNTESIRNHMSYSTFNYRIVTDDAAIRSADVNVPIIIDGYSLTTGNYRQVAEACAIALRNGSTICILWVDCQDFVINVEKEAYGQMSGEMADKTKIDWIGMYNGNNTRQCSQYISIGAIVETEPYMGTLTETYEWSVRIVFGQPYSPSLYP